MLHGPNLIMSDFERATLNIEVFPSVEQSGCLFHFSQAVYRKAVSFGFKTNYHNDSKFNLDIRCFCTLSFLSCEDVIIAYEELSESKIVPDEILSYFDCTYLVS